MQFREQPALLQRRLRFRLPQRSAEHQSLDLAQRPHRGRDQVAAQAVQGSHPLVPVDHNETVRLARRHHHYRDLLASLRQRPEQPSLLLWPPHPQGFVTQVELVELKLQVTPARLLMERRPRTQLGCAAVSS